MKNYVLCHLLLHLLTTTVTRAIKSSTKVISVNYVANYACQANIHNLVALTPEGVKFVELLIAFFVVQKPEMAVECKKEDLNATPLLRSPSVA